MNSSLFTLLELAERNVDDAAAKLGRAIQSGEESEEKLRLLQGYRDEYATRMQTQLMSGRDMQHIRNFQSFLGKIDEAIQGQHQLVIYAQKLVQLERTNWQEQERKKMSFVTLNDRAEKIQLKKEVRRDQVRNDEFGIRALFNTQGLRRI